MKRAFKWVGGAILALLGLSLLLVALLYFPPVQKWAAKQAAVYASEKTGMDISVGGVSIGFPLDIRLDDVKVIKGDKNSLESPDTIADISHVTADIAFWPLLKGKVEARDLKINDGKIDTDGLIDGVRVNGKLGTVELPSNGIDLKGGLANIEKAKIENTDLSISMMPSKDIDDDGSGTKWKINVDDLSLKSSSLAIHTLGDSLSLAAKMDDAKLKGVNVDLEKSCYEVASADWKGGSFTMDRPFEPHSEGLDMNHLQVSDVDLGIDSLQYQMPDLNLKVRHAKLKEKSGIDVADFSGTVRMDAENLYLPDAKLKTSKSTLQTSLTIPLDGLSGDVLRGADGKLNGMSVTMNGTVGMDDLKTLGVELPEGLQRSWPKEPIMVNGTVRGSMKEMELENVVLTQPNTFTATVSGSVKNVDNDKSRTIDLDVNATAYNLKPITSKLAPSVNIPYGTNFNGNVKMKGTELGSTFTARHGKGTLRGTASMNTDETSYTAKLTANNFPLQHFLPSMKVSPLTGKIDLKGKGTDLMSPKTNITAKAQIDKFSYAGYSLDNVIADVQTKNGLLNAQIDSHNPSLTGKLTLAGKTNAKQMRFTTVADIVNIDLKKLGITENDYNVMLCGNADVVTDLKDYYQVSGSVGDMLIKESNSTYHPDDMTIDLLTRIDTTHAVVDGSDFKMRLDAHGGYKLLGAQLSAITDSLRQASVLRRIDQSVIRGMLPTATLEVDMGNDNFIARELNKMGYAFSQANANIRTSVGEGINGIVALDSLTLSGFQLDTIRLVMNTEDDVLKYSGIIANNKDNPDYTFRSLLDGALNDRGTTIHAKVYDAKDELGIDLGLQAALEQEGIRVTLTDDKPVLGYKTFRANKDGYFYLGNNRRVSADLKMVADDGAGVQIYSNDENTEALQDVTASLHKFDVAKLLSALPYTPNISGTIDSDFHIIQTDDQTAISTNIDVAKMTYEKSPLGDVSTEFVYIPKADGSHFIDGILSKDNREVAAISGSYLASDSLDAVLQLERMPLDVLNGFIPDRIFGLRGYGDGSLSVKGTIGQPLVDGEVYLDSSYIYSEPYGVEMRFANDPVRIDKSRLLFENFEVFANNNSPLTIAGNFDFYNLDRMTLDVMMRAENFQLIDAKENPRSEAYGKAFVNFFGSMKGPVESLQMRGKLDVLGSTDMTYILRDSELSTDNQLDELVKFTNLEDTTTLNVVRPPLTGFNMDLSMAIDEGAHILCALNAEKSNFIDLMGGGDLRLRYNPSDGIGLNGRYTLMGGEMKYTLPIIPLKTFEIQRGSYLEFTGKAMNPTLNITATEAVKATVNESEGNGRAVDFHCGVRLSKTLSNPGIEFIIEAPGDMSIQDELNTMTAEERGKVAITMLASGMYLTDGNTSSFTMNNALSTFLQSEINNIAGTAMRSMGLNLGMSVDNSVSSSGSMQTDYNFRFSKRLWNNRLNVIVGGKVSTGADLDNRDNTFFDNVELEYRLNKNASQYLRLFYDNSTYDWLDGLIGQYGVGFKWTRKLRHFKDIFRFKSDNQVVPVKSPESNDSLIIKEDIKADSLKYNDSKEE